MSAPASTHRHGALHGLIDALHRQGVGPRHDDEFRIRARVHRRLDPIDHFLLRYHLFTRTMAAALGLHLVLDVQTRGPNLMKDLTVRAMLKRRPSPYPHRPAAAARRHR